MSDEPMIRAILPPRFRIVGPIYEDRIYFDGTVEHRVWTAPGTKIVSPRQGCSVAPIKWQEDQVDSEQVAGVAGQPQASNINRCDSAEAQKQPAETAENPPECRTELTRNEVLRRLEFLAGGGIIGHQLPDLATAAGRLILATPPGIEFSPYHDAIKIEGISFSMGLMRSLAHPSENWLRVIARDGEYVTIWSSIPNSDDVKQRLASTLAEAGRSPLGLPGNADTWVAMLDKAGLALVVKPKLEPTKAKPKAEHCPDDHDANRFADDGGRV